MKNIILPILALFFLYNLEAQQPKLYGLYYEFESFNDSLGTYAGNQYFVDINAQTALIENTISINDIDGVYLGNSTLDAQNAKYIFYGVDNSGQTNLVKVEINTGEVELLPTSEALPKEIEYDLQTASLYGLRYNGISDEFVAIDLETAEVNVINAIPNIVATVVGTSAFDSNLGRYFIVGATPSFENKLFTIDAETGEVLFEVTVSGNINELSYNVVSE